MIEVLSEKVATAIKRTNELETTSIPIMKYSLIIIFNTLFTIILCLMIGATLGKFQETIITLVSYISLRFFSGGHHFKSAMVCTVVSTAIIVIIPLINITNETVFILTILTVLLVGFFAPSNIRGVARMPEKYFPLLKVVSLLIVCTNLFLSNHQLALAFFVQGISLIPLKKEV
jgi:accessory gene regulator B